LSKVDKLLLYDGKDDKMVFTPVLIFMALLFFLASIFAI
jgi:hypothetical protein